MAAMQETDIINREFRNPPFDLKEVEATPAPQGAIFEAEKPPTLKKYYHGVDLIRELEHIDKAGEKGLVYETKCFAEMEKNLTFTQYAFGPGLLNVATEAMRKTLYDHVPKTTVQKFGIPDALIFEVKREGLVLTTLAEYRVGKCKPLGKLHGFNLFTNALRSNPQIFAESVGNAIGGEFPIRPIIVPPDEEIGVEFFAPRGFRTSEDIYIEGFSFPVSYETVPLDK